MAAPSLRRATAAEAAALRDLEREANLVALAHVFPPDEFPYPDEAVLARWRDVLDDPAVRVLVAEDAHGLACLVAFDTRTIRHLAVRPDRWGTGLARAALDAADRLAGPSQLWCLRDNHRALGLYEHLGWRRTGREQAAEFPPFPVEVELTRPSPDLESRRE